MSWPGQGGSADPWGSLCLLQEAARLEVEQKESALVALQLELHDMQTAQSALAAEKQHADVALAAMREEYRALQQMLASAEGRLEQVSCGPLPLPAAQHVETFNCLVWHWRRLQSGSTHLSLAFISCVLLFLDQSVNLLSKAAYATTPNKGAPATRRWGARWPPDVEL